MSDIKKKARVHPLSVKLEAIRRVKAGGAGERGGGVVRGAADPGLSLAGTTAR
jgi:hypothetical protein